MSLLSEYNPLKHIQLRGAALSDPEGIIVVVGPNSSGKTLFLRDIENYLSTGLAKFIVCSAMTLRKPTDPGAFVQDLIHNGYLRGAPGAPDQYVNYVPHVGHHKRETGATTSANLANAIAQLGVDQ